MFNLLVIIFLVFKLMLVFGCVRWWLYRSRDTHSGRLARLVCIAFLGVILLPVGSATLPVIRLDIIPVNVWHLFTVDLHLATPLMLKVIMAVYLIGVFCVLGYRFWHLLAALEYVSGLEAAPAKVGSMLMRIKKDNGVLVAVGLKVGESKLCSEDGVAQGPFTLGAITPVIVLPKVYSQWSLSTLNRVLTHELAHVARKDWFWQNTLQILTAFVWFLPSAWRLGKQFSWLSELNADDAVLSSGSGRSDYADDLLNIAAGHNRVPQNSLALMDGSYCYERIAAILDGSRLRGRAPFKQTSLWGWLLAALAWLMFSIITLDAAAVSVWDEGELSQQALTIYHLPAAGEAGKNRDLVLPSKFTAAVQPSGYLESVVVIEREHQASRDALLSDVESDINQLASMDVDNVIAPSVTVHGYVAMRAVIPEYPRRAQRKNIEGQVIVQFDVLPSGKAGAIRIAMASPKHVFDDAVLEAMAKSIFKPAMDNGRPIKTEHATQTFTFRLSEGAKTKTFNPTFGTPIQTAEQSTHAVH